MRLISNVSYIFTSNSPEPEITALFIAINQIIKPAVFYDVGANIGYYSWLLKSQNPNISITLFEPDPINYRLITETIGFNRLTGIKTLPYAVSDEVGKVSFAQDLLTGATGTLEEASTSFSSRYHKTLPKIIMVERITLDELKQLNCIPYSPVDLIKIDVEGHEEKVLRGAERLLNEDQPILIFECFQSTSSIFNLLRTKNYSILNAERFCSDLTGAVNFVALPAKYEVVLPGLIETWKKVYQAWKI
jgi:FkbM family methyltransferase